MRKLGQWMLFLAMVTASAPLFAATATEFYVTLLRRGVAEVEAGRNAEAVMPLRIAAFGLLDSVEHYQIAQAHLVVAFDRMNQPDSAREAANRLVAAERIERKFASLGLSPAMRTAFATSAKKFLPAPDAALLLNAPPAQPAQPQPQPQTSSKPSPAETPKKVAESSSRQVVEKPAATTGTPATTTPATTTPPPSSTTGRLDDSKAPPAPRPAPVQTTQPAKPAVDVPARIAAGDRALLAANLTEARKIYRELLDVPSLDHASAIRIAEGLYRSRDFAGALAAFQRVGNLRSGEEAYRYYIAVAAYETRQFDRAKRELAAALPFIEITPDVQRYRAKIESGR